MPKPSVSFNPSLKQIRPRTSDSNGYRADCEQAASCCGISEMVFDYPLQKLLDDYGGNGDVTFSWSPDFDEWQEQNLEACKKITETDLRRIIRNTLYPIADNRVIVVGIPVKLAADASSDYYVKMPAYDKLRNLLPKFGFVQIGEPYKNKNSGNTIVVFVGKKA